MVELKRGAVRCADGNALDFDVLSIDTGPLADLGSLPGSAEHAVSVRPIGRFIAAWRRLVERILGECRRFDLAIVGAGAAGVELAFAIQRRAATDGWSHLFITLPGSEELLLPGAPAATRRHTARLLAWSSGASMFEVEGRTVAALPPSLN